MAQDAVRSRSVSIRFACQLFIVSESCYRYQPQQNEENAVIADWLLRITVSQRNWGFGLCFLYLRNVKGFRFNQGVPDLLRAVAEHANKAEKTTETG